MAADEQPPSSIAERIVGGSSGIDEAIGTRVEDDSTGGGAEGGETPAPLTTESVEALLAERLTPLQESLAERDQEIAYLRGAQAEQSRQIAQPRTAPAPVEKPKSYLESTPKEQALRDLENNPLETLARIIDDKLSPLVAKLNGVDGTLNRSAQERAFETAAQADLTELNETYGHLKDHPSFGKEADVEFNKLKVAEGGYQPGMLTRASARVFARLAKAGQITTNGGAAAGGTTSVSRSFRNGNSHDAGNSSGAGGGEGGRGGDPKSISDLQASGQLTATDAAAAKKVMSKLGVSEADYVRRLNLARKDNPRFGER